MDKQRGSITVFLSLTGILVVALLGTLLETARFGLCANHLERSLVTSTEALLSEYSIPLQQHYGLFFIESGGDSYESGIAGYLKDSINPQKNKMNFLEQQMEELRVTKKEYAGDNQAAPLQTEINSMMLRKLGKEKLNDFLSGSKEIMDTSQQAQKIDKEVEQQEKEAECDKELLKLMKLVDGITVSNGEVSCEKNFIKMFSVKKKKSQNFGITQACVWKEMKGNLCIVSEKKETISKVKKKIDDVIKKTAEAIQLRKKLQTKVNEISGGTHQSFLKEIINSTQVLFGNQKILEQVQKELKAKDCDVKKIIELFRDYDTSTICFDYTGVTETGGGKNPLHSLGDAWDKGILNLVFCGKDGISPKSVKKADKYATLYGEEKEETVDDAERVSDFADEEEVSLSGVLGDIGEYGRDEFFMNKYIETYFKSLKNKQKKDGWKTTLQYQWEYIIGGNESDEANLASILNRLLLVRTVVNATAIMKDSKMRKEAYAAALAVVGFSGLEPLVRLTQTLILIAWSFVESLVDVSGILQERDVPIVKSSKDILTSFSEIFLITNEQITSRAKKFKKATEKSFGYEEYILVFLACMSQTTRRYRIMDLIEQDMQVNGYKNFQFGRMVYGVTVDAKTSIPARFFHFPTIQNMLGRKISAYPGERQVTVRYV